MGEKAAEESNIETSQFGFGINRNDLKAQECRCLKSVGGTKHATVGSFLNLSPP